MHNQSHATLHKGNLTMGMCEISRSKWASGTDIAAKAVFLPVDSFSPSAGRWWLPTRENAPVNQILTLVAPFNDNRRTCFEEKGPFVTGVLQMHNLCPRSPCPE